MRYILYFLTALFCTAVATAQDVPQGSSQVPIGTYEEPTNAAVQVAAEVSTNLVSSAKASFLLDAGVQYADDGEYAEAEQAYLRAMKDDPNNPDIRFRLGTLYIQMQRYPQAVEVLEALSEEFPDNAGIHNNLAWIYATGKGIKSGTLSLRHAREAILSNPTQASLWNTLAEAYYVFGDYKKALRSADVAIELLRQQNGTEAAISSFEGQRAKIQRAESAYNQFLGLEEDE